MLPKNGLCHALVFLALAVALPTFPATADCGKLCDRDFMKKASPARVYVLT